MTTGKANCKILSAITAITLLTTVVDATDDGSGAYIGIGLGSTAYVDSGFVKEQQTAEDEMGSVDSGFKIYGGYQFTPIIGVEASYIDYGKFAAGDYTHASKSVNVAANLGYSFLEGQLRPFGLLGFSYLRNTFPHDNTPLIEENHFAMHLGLGLDYTPRGLGGLGFRMAYEGDSFSYDVDSNITTDEDTYRQAFGILYLGVHYKF